MKPYKLIMLIVTGQGPWGISQIAPRNVIGMPMITQKATFMRKNNDRTRKTSSAPCHIFFIIMLSRSFR